MKTTAHATRILIVDDDRGLARLIEKTIRRDGHATAIAHSVTDAASWLKDNRADLMLLDLKLPDSSGMELVSRMKAGNLEVPYVIITGQGDERVAVDMMKRGALDYLVKDAQFMEFLPMVVQRALAQLERERRLKEAERALLREHLFGSAVLEATGAATIVFDAKGRVVKANRAFKKAVGCGQEAEGGDVALLPCTQLASQPTLSALFERMRDHPLTVEENGSLITQSGAVRSMAWSVSALQGDDGMAEYVIASGIDITEQRQLQRELLDISELEKRRIGHDIHDGLGQVLTGVDMLIKVLHKRLAQTSSGDAHAIGNISQYVQDAIKQARMLAQGLSPVELQQDGLMEGLRELAKSTGSLFKTDCAFHCGSPIHVADHARSVQLYRIAQEAISNAVKHGKARHIEISLKSETDNRAVLSISNDGLPFVAPGSEAKPGMGLRTMKYRAEMIGASLVVQPAVKSGTEVVCKFAPHAEAGSVPAAE